MGVFQTSIHPYLPFMAPLACIAHRGNSIDAPENTLEAFQQAVDLGADFMGVDVHLTEDGVPVIIHDLLLSRTIANQAVHTAVSDLNFAQIKQLDAGKWFGERFTGAKIPSQEEVIHLFG